MNNNRYSAFAMLLHWAIAILVIVNWRIPETAEHMPREEAGAVMANHFSVGLTILLLVLLRLAWRFVHAPPPLAAHLKGWERLLAKTTHTLFYVLLIGMPVAGWIAMSSFGRGIPVWGLFEMPPLPISESMERGQAIFAAHAVAGTILLVLVAIHVLGTLKHTLLDKDGNLFRMLPFGTPKQ
jgi:cytochrome b561